MASIVFGGGITNIIGSHSGNTFARNKGGSYMKKKSHGVNPRSQLQLARRTTVGTVSKYYSYTLTDAQRAAWRTFASTNPVINRLGNTSFLSAQQMFTKLNCPAFVNNGTIQNLPPASTAIGSPAGMTIDADRAAGGHVHLSLSATGAVANDMAQFWFSPPMNPGRNFISSELRAVPGLFTLSTTFNVVSEYIAIFGSIPSGPGQRIFGRAAVCNLVTGITTSYLQLSAIWT